MKKQPIDRHYVSPLDEFLQRWNKDHPQKSKSQLAEMKKYARVFLLRDDPNVQQRAPEDQREIWENF